jgi:hypothetical protein
MAVVTRGPRTRRSLVGASILGVLSLAVLPPQHLHVSRTDDGHHRDFIHRHFEPHHPITHETTFDDEDHDPQWLDSSFTTPKPAPEVFPLRPSAAVALVVIPSPIAPWCALRAEHAPVHGPPGTTPQALRAPPAFPA